MSVPKCSLLTTFYHFHIPGNLFKIANAMLMLKIANVTLNLWQRSEKVSCFCLKISL